MSISASVVVSRSDSWPRMSPIRFCANTVEPAPMKVIFATYGYPAWGSDR